MKKNSTIISKCMFFFPKTITSTRRRFKSLMYLSTVKAMTNIKIDLDKILLFASL